MNKENPYTEDIKDIQDQLKTLKDEMKTLKIQAFIVFPISIGLITFFIHRLFSLI